MTEAEWLACDDPAAMLHLLGGRISDRKLRAFICACARSCWHLLGDGRSREAVEKIESMLDGPARAGGLAQAEGLASQAQYDVWLTGGGGAGSPVRTPEWSAALFAFWATKKGEALRSYYSDNSDSMQAAPPPTRQVALLRDLARRPWYDEAPRAPGRAWITATARSLARAAYEQRALPSVELDPARLAVLADALEEAGCDETDVLGHLRGPGPHVRGCWAVDLILGQS